MGETEQFIARSNIRRFKGLLDTSKDEKQKKILRQLLADEQEHLRRDKPASKS
jgi:rubrerythrin